MKKKLKNKTVYFYYGTCYIHAVTFIRWQRTRMCTGGEDTNKIGTGAVVKSDWLFSKHFMTKVFPGLKRGQDMLRPYWPIYRTYRDAQLHKGVIRRPKPTELKPIKNK